MADNIGAKIGIEGGQTYKKEMADIVAQTKTLQSEMKAVTSSFDKNTTAEQKNAKQKEVLNKQIDTQEKKLKLLETALADSTAKYGENDAKTQKYQKAIYDARAELNNMKKSLDEVGEEVKDNGEEMKTAGENASVFGDVLKANLLSEAITKGMGLLKDAISGIASSLKDAVFDSSAFADDILTMSTVTGMSTQSLQEFEYMAGLIDTDVSTITGSIKKLTKNMSSARDGSESMADNFETLGVSVTNADGTLRDSNDVFFDVIDALGNVSNETERDALAMDIFGKSASDLNPLIQTGADGLEAFRKEAQEAGYVLNDDQLATLGSVDDAWQRWSKTLDVVKREIGVGLAPAFEGFLTIMKDWVASVDWTTVGEQIGGLFKNLVDNLTKVDIGQVISDIVAGVGGFIETIGKIDFGALFESISNIITFISDNGAGIVALIGTIATAMTAFKIASLATTPALAGLGATLSTAFLPIVGIVAGVVAVIAVIKNWGKITKWFKGTAEKVGKAVGGAFSKLKDGATKAFSTMKENITDAFSKAKETLTNTADRIKTGLSTAWEYVKTGAGTAWENIKKNVGDKFTKLKEGLSTTADNIKTGISTAWDNIKTGAGTAWESIKTDVGDKFETLKTGLGTTAKNIKETVSDWFDKVKKAVTKSAEDTQTDTQTAFDNMNTNIAGEKGVLATMLSGVTSKAEALASAIVGGVNGGNDSIVKYRDEKAEKLGASVMITLQKGIKGEKTDTKNAIKDPVAEAKKAVEDDKVGFKTAGEGLMTGMQEGINDGKGTKEKGLTKTIEDVKAEIRTIKGLKDDGKTWGKDIADNIAEGFKSGIPNIKEQARQASEAIKNPFTGRTEENKYSYTGFQSLQTTLPTFAEALTGGGTTTNYGGIVINMHVSDSITGRRLIDEIEAELTSRINRRKAVFG